MQSILPKEQTLSHIIKNSYQYYQNPHQGSETKIVFVCTMGMLRSPTAASVASRMGYNARACGVDPEALIKLSSPLIWWADIIVFMDQEACDKALRTTAEHTKLGVKGLVWNIPDIYKRNDPELIAIIEQKLNTLKHGTN